MPEGVEGKLIEIVESRWLGYSRYSEYVTFADTANWTYSPSGSKVIAYRVIDSAESYFDE